MNKEDIGLIVLGVIAFFMLVAWIWILGGVARNDKFEREYEGKRKP